MSNRQEARVRPPSDVIRDDRIFLITRLVSTCIPPFLVAAFFVLYLFPDKTKELFAWTIKPEMTPLLMGAGYISGSYFFTVLLLSGSNGKWHRYASGFLAITAFTWFMLGATLLHLERFNKSHVSFFAWTILYVVTPFIVPALWLYNRRTDPRTPEANDARVPDGVRYCTAASGALMLGVAAFLFLLPSKAIDIWPWTLSPLTARVVGGWFALPGTLGIAFGFDSRWTAWKTLIESQAIGLALILLGIIRAWDNFNTSRITTWLFVGGISGLLAGVTVLWFVMESKRRKTLTPA